MAGKDAKGVTGMQKIGMLTADVALLKDPVYKDFVSKYTGPAQFEKDFKKAWYKLTTRDMGPRSRCSNIDAADPKDRPPNFSANCVGSHCYKCDPKWCQQWQFELPPPPTMVNDLKTMLVAIKAKINELLTPD